MDGSGYFINNLQWPHYGDETKRPLSCPPNIWQNIQSSLSYVHSWEQKIAKNEQKKTDGSTVCRID